jgi:beta-glucosidase
MKSIIFTFIYMFSFCFSLAAAENDKKPDYLNPELSVAVRVNDLVSRMTLEEKVSQMIDRAEAIERLQIPEYFWWNECLHGVANAGIATVFPQAIGLAATWNTDLMFQIATVISTEARAKHHDFVRRGEFRIFRGLTFWSPNINIFRDPRWGRGQETYGEDPYLTARMGVAFVKGLQGDDPKYFKVISTPKHYAVHSGPEPERHRFDAITDMRDLYDTYLPAFEACVREAGAYSVMCAYNRYLGEACCGSSLLLKEILRDKWGFEGYVVSDCGAIDNIFRDHKIVETAPEAAALAVKSGTDLNCGRVYDPALVEAVKQGFITEEEIDVSVKRLFTARFKLGMFDPPEMVPYARIPIEKNDCEEHRRLSIRAAQESIVLLKNLDNFLPLKKDLKKIAVIGPTADSYTMLLGNYNGTPSRYVTPLQGIKNKVADKAEVVHEQGCNIVKEGAIGHALSSELVSVEGKSGLRAEYFKNKDLEGEPFFSKIDPLNNSNLIWGAFIPELMRGMDFSIRWSGGITVPITGDYNFIVKGDDGYRLYIDDKILVEDWTDHQMTTKSNQIQLEAGKSYNFKLEFFQSSGWPFLSVEWEMLNVDHFKNAVDLASSSDIAIFVGGITAELEREEMRVDYEGFKGGDRTHIKLPEVQENLLKAIHATGTPVVLVLTSGSALAVNWAKENVPAIIQLWYPGQEGGTALADVLFGDYNPAGRLPVTFYKSVDQLPPFEDYNMKGRTYRYFEDEPLFAFGYGLSYTKFEYKNLKVPEKVKAGDNVKISVQVKNTGKIAGDEVVQLYVKDMEASVPVPIRALQGMKRIHLKPGEEQKVEFMLEPKQLSVITDNVKYMVEPGVFEIAVGGALPGSNPPTTEVIIKQLQIVGNPYHVK